MSDLGLTPNLDENDLMPTYPPKGTTIERGRLLPPKVAVVIIDFINNNSNTEIIILQLKRKKIISIKTLSVAATI